MPEPIEYAIATDGDAVILSDLASVKEGGIPDETTFQSVFGPDARFVRIELYEATHEKNAEIQRQTLIMDPQLGPREDPALLAQKRARVMIKAWSGLPSREGKDADPNLVEARFNNLKAAEANFISNAIASRMTPLIASSAFFSMRLRSKQNASATANESLSPVSMTESENTSTGSTSGLVSTPV